MGGIGSLYSCPGQLIFKHALLTYLASLWSHWDKVLKENLNTSCYDRTEQYDRAVICLGPNTPTTYLYQILQIYLSAQTRFKLICK